MGEYTNKLSVEFSRLFLDAAQGIFNDFAFEAIQREVNGVSTQVNIPNQIELNQPTSVCFIIDSVEVLFRTTPAS